MSAFVVAEQRRLQHLLGTAVRVDEPLGPKTTYRVGGTAALYYEIAGDDDLERLAQSLEHASIELLVVGNGSNLLVADSGFSGLAVRLVDRFGQIDVDVAGHEVRAGGGASFPTVARRSAAEGLAGLEWAVGIPGTAGGAVRMNAGGHGSETAAHLRSFRVVGLRSGSDERRDAQSLDASYRHTNLGDAELVVDATFGVSAAEDVRAPIAEIDEIVAWRRCHQPGGRNCGSVFTNPPGDSAGRIIEACGLKGMRVGSAQVSDKHANFIQADAGGRADDVRALIELVQQLVAARSGIDLVPELAMVGFDR